MSDPLQEIIEELTYSINRATSQQSEANYLLVQMKLSELSGALRELHQAMTAKTMKVIINKLGSQQPLSSDELELVHDWIVGDALGFIENEKNFNAWLSLFGRLTNDLKEIYSPDISHKKVLQLSALTQIANRLIPNIIYYISERERVSKFDKAVSDGIDTFEAKAYRDMLIAKLESSDV